MLVAQIPHARRIIIYNRLKEILELARLREFGRPVIEYSSLQQTQKERNSRIADEVIEMLEAEGMRFDG